MARNKTVAIVLGVVAPIISLIYTWHYDKYKAMTWMAIHFTLLMLSSPLFGSIGLLFRGLSIVFSLYMMANAIYYAANRDKYWYASYGCV